MVMRPFCGSPLQREMNLEALVVWADAPIVERHQQGHASHQCFGERRGALPGIGAGSGLVPLQNDAAVSDYDESAGMVRDCVPLESIQTGGSKPWLRGVATGQSTAARSRPLAAAAINKIRLITFLQSGVDGP